MSTFLISVLLTSIPTSLGWIAWQAGNASSTTRGKRIFHLVGGLTLLFVAIVTTKIALSAAPVSVFSAEPTRLIMLGLIMFMGIIVVRFSHHYMAGEIRINYFWRWLSATLAAVSLVVISNHLVLFWLAWLAISLALHKLLMFYPERPRAALAAHKKFILARSAELLLLSAFALLYWQHGTAYISEIVAHYSKGSVTLSAAEKLSAVLIAIAALIKCAQLPLHGWLIQVVEAPTPVSALLHAGVINLGGFLLILFAPLFIQASAAQWIVLVVAGLTTLLSALIMTTRISIKVRLAWSTSAQMGLMLVECALGLFELALLHLVTHSLYKAYAFLNSGNAVAEDIRRRLSPASTPELSDWLLGAVLAFSSVGAVWLLNDYHGALSVWLLMAMALTLFVATRHRPSAGQLMPVALISLMVATSYGLMKHVFGFAVATSGWQVTAFSGADLWAMALILTLMLLSYLLRYQSQKPQIQALSALLFAGLYLDEWLTRFTLKIWPTRLPVRNRAKVAPNRYLSDAKESH